MLAGLHPPCRWQENWREEDLVVTPSGVLETCVTGMGATGQAERRGRHKGLEADGLGHTLDGRANG